MYVNLIGTDGSGKNAQLEKIMELYPSSLITREPGGTPEAETIRSVILEKDYSDKERLEKLTSLLVSNEINLDTHNALSKAYEIIQKDGINGEAEVYLYAASRSESLEKSVRPAIQAGKHILGNRSVACSIAYQGNARNLGMEEVWSVNSPIVKNTYPDLEIFLDLPIPVAMQRLSGRTEKQDRLDAENIEFFEKVRAGYLYFYKNICPYRYAIIDASGSIEEIYEQIRKVIFNLEKEQLNL